MLREYTLTARDRWFLKRRTLDPVTKATFSMGDCIVICAHCKAASLRDSWNSVGYCANCQCRNQLTFDSFSQKLLESSDQGHAGFKIMPSRRGLSSVRLPNLAASTVPSAKLCLCAGACSVLLCLGICGFAYVPLSGISQSDSVKGVISEAYVGRYKLYREFALDYIQEKAAQPVDAARNRLSGVGEKFERPVKKLTSLKYKFPFFKETGTSEQAESGGDGVAPPQLLEENAGGEFS